MARVDVGEGRRSRSPVEVLVRAAGGEVDAGSCPGPISTDPAEWQRSHTTSAPASCTAAVIAGQVREVPRAVGDWLRTYDGGGRPRGRRAPGQRSPRPRDPLRSSAASGPLPGRCPRRGTGPWGSFRVQHDLCSGGVVHRGQGGPDQLVEDHGGGVGDDGLARGRAEDRTAQLVADGLRQLPAIPRPSRGSAGRPSSSWMNALMSPAVRLSGRPRELPSR